MPALGNYDPAQLAERLTLWLGTQLPEAKDIHITDLVAPESTGHSSETILCVARWNDISGPVTRRMVLRTEPTGHTVFASYDLLGQATVMRRLAGVIPVPEVLWYEPDPDIIGHPFIVMGHVDGLVPPDNLPYTMDGWLLNAAPSDQAALERNAVATLSQIHAADWAELQLDKVLTTLNPNDPLTHSLDLLADYYQWAAEGLPNDSADRGMEWLRANQPTAWSPSVLSWGDSRLGNMMFENFKTVAVLDWEMARIAPREFDVAWFILFERFFSEFLNCPNLDGFASAPDVIAMYEQASGATLHPLGWYEVYGAVYYAMIMMRVIGSYRRNGIDPGFTESDNPATAMLDALLSQQT